MAATFRTPFYLTLVSNASMKLYPNNKPQSFKTELSSPLLLDGKWEVALCEYYYPNNMLNLTEETVFHVSLYKRGIYHVDNPEAAKPGSVDNLPQLDGIDDGDDEQNENQMVDEEPIIKSNRSCELCVGTIVQGPGGLLIMADAASKESAIKSETVSLLSNGSSNSIVVASATGTSQSAASEKKQNYFDTVDEFNTADSYTDSPKFYVSFKYRVPKGKFDNLDNLCRLLNNGVTRTIRNHQIENNVTDQMKLIKYPPIEFVYDQIENRIGIESRYWKTHIEFLSTAYLPFAMGIPRSTTKPVTRLEMPILGKEDPSLTQIYPAMFIYTNIIEHQLVANTSAPLLRTVPLHNRQSHEVVSESFTRPQYLELNTNYIKTIEIKILNDAGDDILFQKGKTVLVLHFRPRAL